MVAPITGPFETLIQVPPVNSFPPRATVTHYDWKRGFKQAKPHTLQLSYERKIATVNASYNPVYGAIDAATSGHLAFPLAWEPLYAHAYERLKSKVADRAELLLTLADLNRSLQMIHNRLLQLKRFTGALKRRNFKEASRQLHLDGVPKRVSPSKYVADNYLEYHFGWSPLIGDIYSAVKVLQSPINNIVVSGKAHGDMLKEFSQPYRKVENPTAIYPSLTYDEVNHYRTGTPRVRMGCSVAVTNPNLWLANQIGLVNPLAVAWDRIPFSFVADWFVNVSQFLQLGTDFLGLTLEGAWTSDVIKGSYFYYTKTQYRYWENGGWVYSGSTKYSRSTWTWMLRRDTLVKPSLTFKPVQVWGWRRAASAAALYVQQIDGIRPHGPKPKWAS